MSQNYEGRNRKHHKLDGRDTYIFVRVINAITLSANGEELRATVKWIAEETELKRLFLYGCGIHHFFTTHRRLSNREPMEHRILKIEF